MSARSQIGSALRSTLGPQRTESLRRTETDVRRQLAERISPAAPKKKAPAGKSAPAKPAPTGGNRSREQMIQALRASCDEGLGANSQLPKGLSLVSPDPHEPHTDSGMERREFLQGLHDVVQPETYFEVGIDLGQSLTLSRCRSVAVDPGYRIFRELNCDLRTYRLTSDDFFALQDPMEHLGGTPVHLSFIDGMHLAEFALRDFMNTEKHMSPGGVIVLDDMLPRNSLEASRIRYTRAWTGDVFKVHDILRRYRPDLTLVPVNTEITGSYMVVGLDPTNTVLDEKYEEFRGELEAKDPQTVDTAWLQRQATFDPRAILGSPAWARLRELRAAGADRAAYTEVWQEFLNTRQG